MSNQRPRADNHYRMATRAFARWRIHEWLRKHGPADAGDIGRAMHLPPRVCSGMLSILKRLGYAQCNGSPRSHHHRVRWTAIGRIPMPTGPDGHEPKPTRRRRKPEDEDETVLAPLTWPQGKLGVTAADLAWQAKYREQAARRRRPSPNARLI